MLLPVPLSGTRPLLTMPTAAGLAQPAASSPGFLLLPFPPHPQQSSLHLQPERCCGTLCQITLPLCSQPSGSSMLLTVGTGPTGPGLYCLTNLSAHPVPAPSASSLLLKHTSPSATLGASALAVSSASNPPPPDVPDSLPYPPSGLHLRSQGHLPDQHSSTQHISCPSFIMGWVNICLDFSIRCDAKTQMIYDQPNILVHTHYLLVRLSLFCFDFVCLLL